MNRRGAENTEERGRRQG